MKIGEIIKYYRRKNSMTQENLSQGICSVPYLSKLENNQLNPSDHIIKLLCKKMNLVYNDLHNLEDNQLLNDLFNWYELINQNNYEQAFSKKEEVNSKLEYITDMQIKIYYEIFSIYFYIKFEKICDNKVLEKMDNLKNKSILMNLRQQYYMNKVQGYYFYKKSNWKNALIFFEKAYKIGCEIDINEADNLYTLAIIYSRLNNYVNSRKYIKEAKTIFYNNLEFKKVLDCETVIAINYLLEKEYSLAKTAFEKILNNKYLDQESKASVLHNLGVLYYENNELVKSKNSIIESIKYNERTDNLFLLKSYFMLSNISIKLNEPIDEYLNLGLSLSEKTDNKEYFYKFKLLKYKNDKTLSIDKNIIIFLNDDVIPYFKTFGDKDDYIEVLTLLGNKYYQHNHYKKAADIYFQLVEELSIEGGEYDEK
ncbi:helix-turn-helix domain-containing protein [Lysinibacillus sp. NPDC097214]|uniref:helix-turn-helix domain-containing protein n=1 Tax=Lysinibacillus sp. NPDC097214 TaxID=3390584 RepID=UPI003CFE3F0A